MDIRLIFAIYLSNLSIQFFLSLFSQELAPFHLKETLYASLGHIQIVSIAILVLLGHS